jgi:ATP-binding cassette subfamily B (MDR/TAP) protein 1
MQALLDQSVGQAFSSVCNGIAGVTIAFWFSWQLTLINLGILPIAAVAVAIETKAQFSGNEKTRSFYEGATFVASEAISNARTVMSLGLEDFFVKKYQEILEEPYQIKLKGAFVAALGQGLAQSNQVNYGYIFSYRNTPKPRIDKSIYIYVFIYNIF